MPQTFVDSNDINGNSFTVRGNEAHHLARVMRCQVQDHVQLFDGTGRQYKGVLTRINTQEPSVEGRIVEVITPAHSRRFIRLFQGIPKGTKFDYVIEKAVELGADEILPFLSQKSPIKLTPAQIPAKLLRWNRLIKAAAKQCNRGALPAIAEPTSLMDLGNQFSRGFTILFTENPKSRPLKDILRFVPALPEAARINIIIGPESGLSDKEVSWLVGLGAHLASLGQLTLRSETAGLAAVSILNYELNELK